MGVSQVRYLAHLEFLDSGLGKGRGGRDYFSVLEDDSSPVDLVAFPARSVAEAVQGEFSHELCVVGCVRLFVPRGNAFGHGDGGGDGGNGEETEDHGRWRWTALEGETDGSNCCQQHRS